MTKFYELLGKEVKCLRLDGVLCNACKVVTMLRLLVNS